ncbi:Serine/threonine-protein kinase S6KL [Armadillidium vulgare]|nr:Serine/threonine-protein kinase S6KL [Armadillidium vulgare]
MNLDIFSLTDLASNITNRFSVLSGLSFISIVSVPATEAAKRPWSRVSRKRWNQTTLQNEYHQCKTVWPVAQTEALFLPEFPVGIEEKLKLILLGEISRGAFGQVFHVRCSTSHKEYAMKVLSKSQVCSLDSVRQVKQEVMIQHVCSHHPFIAPLTHFWQTRKLLIIMTEYIGYGELHQLWRSLGRLPEQLLSLYVAEIALALDFLHNAGIIYRDLKMENILLDVDGHIKLIDFGLSRWLTYGGHTSTICGTLQFMAPEVLKGEEYGHPADWWSLGIIAYSLYLGHYPVSGYDDHVTMGGAVEKFVYSPPESASKAMKSLITGLLQRSPATRIHTLHQLQKEELFMHIDFDDVRDKKMSPRLALEKYIEGKSRHNFEEFEGLTSTPKRGMPSSECDLGPNSSIPNKLTRSPLMGGRAIMWDRAKRSCSSPLLSSPLMHPGRLGHHDALIKSVSATGYNGAAVPLLQSPSIEISSRATGFES